MALRPPLLDSAGRRRRGIIPSPLFSNASSAPAFRPGLCLVLTHGRVNRCIISVPRLSISIAQCLSLNEDRSVKCADNGRCSRWGPGVVGGSGGLSRWTGAGAAGRNGELLWAGRLMKRGCWAGWGRLTRHRQRLAVVVLDTHPAATGLISALQNANGRARHDKQLSIPLLLYRPPISNACPL